VSWFKKPSGDARGPAQSDPEDGPRSIEPLTDDEVEWVRSTIAALDDQGVRRGDIDDLGRHYDELLTGWLRLNESDRPDPDPVITQIGLALGQIIANHTGLEWGVATGRRGVEIALHRPRAEHPVVIYPAHLVSQRWDAHETGGLATIVRATIQAVRESPAPGWNRFP
jgi:hypothetical protein